MVNTPTAYILSRTPRFYFGIGALINLSKSVDEFGKTVLLVTGKNSFDHTMVGELVTKSISPKNFSIHRYPVSGEPSPQVIDQAVDMFRMKNIDVVVAVGGGSVIDAGKAIAAMLRSPGTIIDYLEGVGTKTPPGKKLPLIAIPTTSGTGSEATKNAVISQTGSDGFKKSLRHDNYVPDIAIIDPELTLECPPEVTAASGMDAFTQLLESYLSSAANPYTDALSLSGLEHISRSLQKVYYRGKDIVARTDMSYASMLSGITLANAGLGVVHGFAQPLGSYFPIPHGVVCGTLMGVVARKTVEKSTILGKTNILDRYATVGKLFFKDQKQTEVMYTQLLIDIIEGYVREFNLPRLGRYGVQPRDFNRIVKATGMKNHPVHFEKEELKQILADRC